MKLNEKVIIIVTNNSLTRVSRFEYARSDNRELQEQLQCLWEIFFFSFIFISWRLITLQYCSGFSHRLT